MISFRNLLIVLVAWTAASPAWLADGSGGDQPTATSATSQGGTTPAQPQQPQKEISPANIPSSLDVSPLGRLSDDLLYTAYLLHPWPNVLAAVSGQLRDSLNKFRTHDYVFRTPRPAIGTDPWDDVGGLAQRKTPLLGKYRLTAEQTVHLLLMASQSFGDLVEQIPQPEYDAEYLTHVIEDLLDRPDFQSLNLLAEKGQEKTTKKAALGFLLFQKPDLACKLIRAAGLPISLGDVVAALESYSRDVLTKLCKLAEDLPRQVAFTKSDVEGLYRSVLGEGYDIGRLRMSQEDFHKMSECYQKVAKEVLKH